MQSENKFPQLNTAFHTFYLRDKYRLRIFSVFISSLPISPDFTFSQW
jgi:hypothetical protein